MSNPKISPQETENLRIMSLKCHELARSKGWWECRHCHGTGGVSSPYGGLEDCQICDSTGIHRPHPESLSLIHAEVSEALEALRDPRLLKVCGKCDGSGRFDGRTCSKCGGSGRSICQDRFVEELADIVIRVFDLAGGYGADLGAAIKEKYEYNATRPHRHGKAF